ncbi:hypothetical protein OAA45_00435 [bacterium]|nr:hypothetical protein [bacterium]
MTKCPLPILSLALFSVILWAGFLTPTEVKARIGESQRSIEGRLLSSGGIVYRDDAVEANRRKGMPYARYTDYWPSSVSVRIYFKTADGRKPTSSEVDSNKMSAGWDLHVVYMNGKSVMEVYKRSQGMTPFEFNQLLAIHSGGSFWKKVEGKDKEEKEEGIEIVSAFGADMVRDDGLVRAKKMGSDTLMVVDAVVDVRLAGLKESDLSGKAPLSVSGF